MKTLGEIEEAVEGLESSEIEELFLLLATRLGGRERGAPQTKDFEPERIAGWIREDEEAYRAFRDVK